MQRQGVVPDVITYSGLISTCEKGKQPERAHELLETMQRQGVVPNVITYNALISTCEKSQQPEQEAMQRQGACDKRRCGCGRRRCERKKWQSQRR